jgi:hypothetical protein
MTETKCQCCGVTGEKTVNGIEWNLPGFHPIQTQLIRRQVNPEETAEEAYHLCHTCWDIYLVPALHSIGIKPREN